MNELRELEQAEFGHVVEVLTSTTERPRSEDFPSQEWNSLREQLASQLIERAVDLSREDLRLACEALNYILLSLDRTCGEKHVGWVNRRLALTRELLKKLPASGEIDLLNPRVAVELFFAEVDLTPEEAAALSENWNSRDLATIRKLHGIKTLLHPTLEIWMRNSAGRDYDDVLTRWAAVFPNMP